MGVLYVAVTPTIGFAYAAAWMVLAVAGTVVVRHRGGGVQPGAWPSPRKVDTELTVGLVVRPFKLDRGHEPQGGMTADAVVEHFQVLEDLGPRLVVSREQLTRRDPGRCPSTDPPRSCCR